ncbi:GTPase Era [Mycoplasma miroungirhinis]|uniref:GTPase Era n=1 Tax=Mycoplasma miroungirhinis TaxID=754516 RepID=A0A6M4JEK8_9MOLU|nr:GTPase Era [Mycoplasma miroungirhinis]QJR44429.1 GTPase Era [Mycoplasma miroungirhinis]
MKVCTIAIIGRPNTGKSTLLNKLIDYDLSIITNVPQTTRDQIRGIYTDDNYQLIFIDTPGIHKAQHLLNEKLNQASYSSLDNVDLALFLQPANEEIGRGDKFIINKLEKIPHKFAIISKIDLVSKEEIDKKAQELLKYKFDTVMGVGFGFDKTYEDILNVIKTEYADKLEDTEAYYDPNYLTDLPMRFIAKETIRETAFLNLREEIPHSIAVVIDEFIEQDEKPYIIKATIFTKKESQKGIIIGASGTMIKKISMLSRKKMENQFAHKIFLEIQVKVNKNWIDNESQIKKLGY